MNWNEFIINASEIFIKIGPTIIFVLLIFLGFIIGYLRGYNKSKHLLVTALILFGINLTFYLLFTLVPAIDTFALSITNNFFGGTGGLQKLLGVSTSCESFKEIIAEYVIKNFKSNEFVYAILTNNYSYINLVVNLSYHIVFALVFIVFYYIEDFICYLVYIIRRKNRKEKDKQLDDFINGKGEVATNKRSWKGGLIGVGRGLVSATIAISILGGTLYVAAGKGTKKAEEYDFKDDNLNFYYQIYSSISDYGNYGIYKLLNSFTDASDMPYYLFALDIVLQGQYEDTSSGTTYSVHFLDEIGSVSTFAQEVASLALKYGGDSLIPIVLGQESKDNLMPALKEIITNYDFQVELSSAIREVQNADLTKKLAMSLAYNVAANIDLIVPSVDEKLSELCKVAFKPNYLSRMIPLEAELINEGADASKLNIPVITSDMVVSQDDVDVLLETIYKIFSFDFDSLDAKEVTKECIPIIRNLSLFGSSGRSEFNPVFSRLYSFSENNYLTLILNNDGGSSNTSSYKALDVNDYRKSALNDDVISLGYDDSDINWGKEIGNLLDCVNSALTIYSKMGDVSITSPFDFVATMFDSNNPNKKIINVKFNEMLDTLDDSLILEQVFGSKLVNSYLSKALSNMMPGIIIPDNIKYANTYDANGNLVSYGETYYLMRLLRFFYSDELKDLREALLSEEEKSFDFIKEKLVPALNKVDPNDNYTLLNYISNSDLLSSMVSASIVSATTQTDGSTLIYIPEVCKHVNSDGTTINVIKKSELAPILSNLTEIMDLIKPLMSGQAVDIAEFINNKNIDTLTQYKLIQGTFANLFIDKLKSNASIIIPTGLETPDSWLGDNGETRKLIYAVRESGIDIQSIIDGGTVESIFDQFMAMSDDQVYKLCTSEVIHYSISNVLTNSDNNKLSIAIPDSVVSVNPNDASQVKINVSELNSLRNTLKYDLDMDSYSKLTSDNFNKLTLDKVEVASSHSEIIRATVSNFITNTDSVVVPESVADESGKFVISSEINKLFDIYGNITKKRIDELTISDINFSNINISSDENINEILKSDILRATITSKIKFGNEELFVSTSTDSYVSKNINNGQDIVVISDSEFKKVLKALKYYSGSDTDFTNINLSMDDINKKYKEDHDNLIATLDSSLVLNMFNSKIKEQVPGIQLLYRYDLTDNVISLSSGVEMSNKQMYSKTMIDTILGEIVNSTN